MHLHLVECAQDLVAHLIIPQVEEENTGDRKIATQPRSQKLSRFRLRPGPASPPAPQLDALLEALGLGPSLGRKHHDGGLVSGPLQVTTQISPRSVITYR